MTATIETIRGDLRYLIEQFESPGHFRFDDLVDNYVQRYGLRQFSEIGAEMPAVLDLLMEHRIEQAPVDRPCPAWCELEPGHRWDSYDSETGREERGHGRQLGKHTSLAQTEYEDATPSDPAGLSILVDQVELFTAAEARQLAAELLNAAEELERVETGR